MIVLAGELVAGGTGTTRRFYYDILSGCEQVTKHFYDTIQHDTMQYKIVPAVQCNTIQCNTTQYNKNTKTHDIVSVDLLCVELYNIMVMFSIYHLQRRPGQTWRSNKWQCLSANPSPSTRLEGASKRHQENTTRISYASLVWFWSLRITGVRGSRRPHSKCNKIHACTTLHPVHSAEH